ncbi:YgaP family membrane protein [Pseudomonas borbori]
MIDTPPRAEPGSTAPATVKLANTQLPIANVTGWERKLSTGLGVALISRGIKNGGGVGLAEIGAGGLLLTRGLTGHCSMKAMFKQPDQELHYLQDELRKAKHSLADLYRQKANLASTTH